MADPMLGQIILFAGNYPPVGWAFCDGQMLDIANNQALYSILGTMYGGDGRINFALPDFRGRTPVSAGQGPGLTNYIMGYRGGSEKSYITTDCMPAHNHEAAISSSSTSSVNRKTASTATQSSPVNAYPAPLSANFGGEQVSAQGYNTTPSQGTTSIEAQLNLSNATVAIGNTGASQPVHHVQPYTAMRYIIAIKGWYPSRN